MKKKKRKMIPVNVFFGFDENTASRKTNDKTQPSRVSTVENLFGHTSHVNMTLSRRDPDGFVEDNTPSRGSMNGAHADVVDESCHMGYVMCVLVLAKNTHTQIASQEAKTRQRSPRVAKWYNHHLKGCRVDHHTRVADLRADTIPVGKQPKCEWSSD